MLASALLALVLAKVVTGQTTALLFPAGFQPDHLQGEVLGTGADGTTYVLSGMYLDLGIPFTMTMVQDETHVSENAGITTPGASFFVDVECGLSGGQASCTGVVSEDSSSSMFTETGPVSLIGVPLGAGSATLTSGSTSVTAGGASSDSAGSSSLSEIPASISVSSKSTATLTTPTSVGSSAASPSATSGASKAVSVRLGLGLPVLLAFMTFL